MSELEKEISELKAHVLELKKDIVSYKKVLAGVGLAVLVQFFCVIALLILCIR